MTLNHQPQNFDIFIGIDVSKTKFTFTMTDHAQLKRSKTIPADPINLTNYIKKYFSNKKIICSYEAGPTGYDLYDHLSKAGFPCIIVSPAAIPKPPNQTVKNDRIDSLKLSELLKDGKLKSIRVPSGIYREFRHLTKTRELHAKLQRATKLRVKSLLLFESLYQHIHQEFSSWSNNYIRTLEHIPCSDAARQRLNFLLVDLRHSRSQLSSATKTLRTFIKQNSLLNQHMNFLQSIDGIGFVTAATLLGKSGDPLLLNHQRELSAFIGLTPGEHSTGLSLKQGPLSPFVDRYLRSLFVEAAWIAIKKNTRLRQFYHRIKQRHHPKIAAKKAIVAVARKLSLYAYTVLKEQRPFVDLS